MVGDRGLRITVRANLGNFRDCATSDAPVPYYGLSINPPGYMFVPGKIYPTSSTTQYSILFWYKISSKFDKIIYPNPHLPYYWYTTPWYYPFFDLWCIILGSNWEFGAIITIKAIIVLVHYPNSDKCYHMTKYDQCDQFHRSVMSIKAIIFQVHDFNTDQIWEHTSDNLWPYNCR